MENRNNSYRIHTNVGEDTYIKVNLEQDYDILEVLSLKISQKNAYDNHNSDYGVVAGRVVANGGFGVPNAKISIFIPKDSIEKDPIKRMIYPFDTFTDKDKNNKRYNLFPNTKVNDCHAVIGTFPSKRFVLDNDTVLEVFEKYYKFTTKTNNAGDYMIFGAPLGSHTIHTDIDLSDIGILSQKPRDMVYKGYNIGQFENPNKFRTSDNIDNLTQVISQNNTIEILPFWGDSSDKLIGITRCDINVDYKFEPTCVFIGSVVSDSASNGISKKCIPTKNMGAMDELTTGSGTIEMIRKNIDGNIEEFQIKGNQLINGDGVWCYQIPMNLDYMKTDEYGNMVPTDDPSKGIPTRTSVRFRISLQDFDTDNANIFRTKVLVPNNPKYNEKDDYKFGSDTDDSSFRDLFWNGVYSVKSYIPRLQKGAKWRSNKFSGIKRVNYFNSNNPIPYNNIRIKIPFMYTMVCSILKAIMWLIGVYNALIQFPLIKRNQKKCMYVSGDLCPELEDSSIPWYFAPRCTVDPKNNVKTKSGNGKHFKDYVVSQVENTRDDIFHNETGSATNDSGNDDDGNNYIPGNGGVTDTSSIDFNNREEIGEVAELNRRKKFILSSNINYFIHCVEMNLAEEYRVIQFDFYNDWINGLIYIPRWMRQIRKKKSYLFGLINIPGKVKACNEESNVELNIVQQCSLKYDIKDNHILSNAGCTKKSKLKCHKSEGITSYGLSRKGIVVTNKNSKSQYAYYFKSSEKRGNTVIKLFATDLILLGTLNECDKWGIPSSFKELRSSTYQLPPNNVLVNKEYDTEIYKDDYNLMYTKASKADSKGNYEKLFLNITGPISDNVDDGYYTEMSGIDWNLKGPLQKEQSNTENIDKSMLFRPGGHFLGLSCSESETNIVSCVNLSRICEHGVWMSQRQEYEYPVNISEKYGSKSIEYGEYNLNPTGVISKDEISDTNYRSVFASLNQNRLRTIIDSSNGYPTYDFKYIYPTMFGGELNGRLVNDEYNVSGLFNSDKKGKSKVYENEKRRINELKDKEYIKFRFGIDNDDDEGKNRNEKFLIKGSSSEGNSMPVYENSFYFYFGLHDGKTALDEFKRQYYATCDENVDLFSETEGNNVVLDNINKIDKGFCSKSGTFEFALGNNTKEKFPIGFYCKNSEGKFIKENGSEINNEEQAKYTIDFSHKDDIFEYSYLETGSYSIYFTTNDFKSQKIEFSIENLKYNSDSYSKNFNINLDEIQNDEIGLEKSLENVFNLDHLKYGGYIAINGNYIEYNGEKIPIFTKNNDGNLEVSKYADVYVECLIDKNPYYICFKGGRLETRTKFVVENIIEDGNENAIIPLFRGNAEYSVYVSLKTDKDCNISENGKFSNYTIIYKSYVSHPMKLDLMFNKISYNDCVKNISHGFKWDSEDNMNLYETDRYLIKKNFIKYDDRPVSLYIESVGGKPPYVEKFKGQYEYIDDTDENKSIILKDITDDDKDIKPMNAINIPTLFYGNVKRKSFEVSTSDSNGKTVPENDMAVIDIPYRPFFVNASIVKRISNDYTFLTGQIYNGITLDCYAVGFDEIYFNGESLGYGYYPFIDDLQNNDKYDIDENDISEMPNTNPKLEPFTLDVRRTDIDTLFGKSFEFNYNTPFDSILDIGSKALMGNDTEERVMTNITSRNLKIKEIEFDYIDGDIVPYSPGIQNEKIVQVNNTELFPFNGFEVDTEKMKELNNVLLKNKDLGIYDENIGSFYAIYEEITPESKTNHLSHMNVMTISEIYKKDDMKKMFPVNFSFNFYKEPVFGNIYSYYMDVVLSDKTNLVMFKGKKVVFKFYNNEYSNSYMLSKECKLDANGNALRIDLSDAWGLIMAESSYIYVNFDVYFYGEKRQNFNYKKKRIYVSWDLSPKKINNIMVSKVLSNFIDQQSKYIINLVPTYKVESNISVKLVFNNRNVVINETLPVGSTSLTVHLPENNWIEGESVDYAEIVGLDSDSIYHYYIIY